MMQSFVGIDRRDFLKFAGVALLANATIPQAWAQLGTTFVAAFPREVLTLDGNYVNLRENDILGLLVDDALFAVDPVHGVAVPLSARSYEFTNDTTLVVHLRDDVLFHDGTPLTVDDVVYTYTLLINPLGQASYQGRLSNWLKGVEPTGKNAVTFHMKYPYATALFDLAMCSKLRKKDSYKDSSKPSGINPEAQALQLNGTGPFRVTYFRPAQEIHLERFAKYRHDSVKGMPSSRRSRFA